MDFRQKITSYSYTPEHQIATITAPNVNNSASYPNVVGFSYDWDGSQGKGTLKSQIDQDLKETKFEYDSWGQLNKVTYPLATDNEIYTPDGRGNVISHKDANG